MAEGLKATFRIVTPMFLAGAHQKMPELRPPAIKGALRFWWRAMQWGPCFNDATRDERKALRLLHKREAEIFGVASGNREGRQSMFRLRARHDPIWKLKDPPDPMTGQKYLLGQGLFHFRDGYSRSAILAGQEMTVYLTFRRAMSDEGREQVEKAFMLMSLLGGLGSRARRGLGSIVMTDLQGSDLRIPQDLQAFEKLLNELLPERANGLPPFTAFSKKTRIDCSCQGSDAWKILDDVGFEMLKYRSYGLNGFIEMQRGDPRFKKNPLAEQNFPNDHHGAAQATQGRCPSVLPQRIVFGLPHNYHFSNNKKPASFEPSVQKDGVKRRRASPLLIHIHRFPDGTCAAIHSFLPARFLPKGIDVQVTSKGALTDSCVLTFKPSWKVIHDYLDRFGERKELLR